MSQPAPVYQVLLTQEDLEIALQAMDQMTLLGADARRLAETQQRFQQALAGVEALQRAQ